MPSIGQENLETVMIDFLGALRRGDFEAAAGLLDPDVSWQGLREEWVCHGREEVVDTFRWGLEQRREIDALEFTRGGEQVALGARGPSIDAVEDEPLEGQIFNVFSATGGSCASTTTGTGGKHSRQPASPRTWTGADQRRRVEPSPPRWAGHRVAPGVGGSARSRPRARRSARWGRHAAAGVGPAATAARAWSRSRS